MKRNLFIAALAILTTMGAGTAQAQSRDIERVAADIIGIRLGTRLSVSDRLHDRRAFDDDRFWCSEIHRRYGVQEVVLLERRRSGISWLDILSDVLWAYSHRDDRYDRRTVVYFPQDTRRYVEVRRNDRDDRRWDDRRWDDHRDDRRWDNHRDDHRDDHRWDDHRGDYRPHPWDNQAGNNRDRNDRDRNDRDRNDRNRDNHGRNDRDRNERDRNDRGRGNDRDRGNRNG